MQKNLKPDRANYQTDKLEFLMKYFYVDNKLINETKHQSDVVKHVINCRAIGRNTMEDQLSKITIKIKNCYDEKLRNITSELESIIQVSND